MIEYTETKYWSEITIDSIYQVYDQLNFTEKCESITLKIIFNSTLRSKVNGPEKIGDEMAGVLIFHHKQAILVKHFDGCDANFLTDIEIMSTKVGVLMKSLSSENLGKRKPFEINS